MTDEKLIDLILWLLALFVKKPLVSRLYKADQKDHVVRIYKLKSKKPHSRLPEVGLVFSRET